jgi:hypothetical protein
VKSGFANGPPTRVGRSDRSARNLTEEARHGISSATDVREGRVGYAGSAEGGVAN